MDLRIVGWWESRARLNGQELGLLSQPEPISNSLSLIEIAYDYMEQHGYVRWGDINEKLARGANSS